MGRDSLPLFVRLLIFPKLLSEAVHRDDLRRDMLIGELPERKPDFSGERVLLVDDGMNDGGTMKMLASYCCRRKVDPMGVLVLDSRLNKDQYEKLKHILERVPIIFLYQ